MPASVGRRSVRRATRFIGALCCGWVLVVAHVAGAADAAYVIHVSCDGLRGDVLAQVLSADSARTLAGFARFVTEGATTFNARTDFTHTNTLPNHTTMLTGRPVLQPAGQPATVHHGYTKNLVPAPGVTLHNGGNSNLSYVASIFDVVHDAGLSTALYASKSKFVLYSRSYDAANGAPDAQLPDNGRDKIDHEVVLDLAERATSMHRTFIAEMAANPFHYTFVHYLDLDEVGHASGWDGSAWHAALRTVDGYLRDILQLATTQPKLIGRTTVLVTTDHGGVGKGHGRPDLAENYTIPVLAWGAGVAPGVDLYAVNRTTRADPGSTRPDYDATPQPIRNGDTGNVALALLGLPPTPGSTLGADLRLRGPTPTRPGS
jgi:hypothetical protein